MSLWGKLFGKGQYAKSFKEKDNMGTRFDSLDSAAEYWSVRNAYQKFEPFVIYTFENEVDAREALLDLHCIHVAADTGNLICTEVLMFGYYSINDSTFEAFVCGNDMKHELWKAAKDSFARHNGIYKNDQEPEKQSKTKVSDNVKNQRQVVFVREDRQQKMGLTMIYRIYKGSEEATAKAFLKDNPVTQQLFYIVVETPEGNYCRDIEGIYKE